MRPFFTFYGGKWRVAPRYPAPEYNTIIEPFAGSAGYSLRHHKKKVILVERDEKIAATWRFLLRATPSEILALPDLQVGQPVDDLVVHEEARLLIGWWCNKGSAQPKRSMSAWLHKKPRQRWGPFIRERIAAQVEGIRHWTIIEGGYTDAPNIGAAWFIDPPYEGAGKHYRHGSIGLDFTALGAWCRSRRGQVMVCENVGATWLPFKPFMVAKANEGKTGGKVSAEALWLRTASSAAASSPSSKP